MLPAVYGNIWLICWWFEHHLHAVAQLHLVFNAIQLQNWCNLAEQYIYIYISLHLLDKLWNDSSFWIKNLPFYLPLTIYERAVNISFWDIIIKTELWQRSAFHDIFFFCLDLFFQATWEQVWQCSNNTYSERWQCSCFHWLLAIVR